MSKLLEGKTAIILGVWNKWSIAYAIAQAFAREGGTLLLTYQNDRAKPTVEELGKELGAKALYPCDVQQQSDIDNLAEAVKAQGHKLDAVVHCLAFANHEDLGNPFVNTGYVEAFDQREVWRKFTGTLRAEGLAHLLKQCTEGVRADDDGDDGGGGRMRRQRRCS